MSNFGAFNTYILYGEMSKMKGGPTTVFRAILQPPLLPEFLVESADVVRRDPAGLLVAQPGQSYQNVHFPRGRLVFAYGGAADAHSIF